MPPKSPTHHGFCIYCAAPIEMNMAEPTCEAHRGTWAQLEARESANYCHRCGRRNLKGYCEHDPCCDKCDELMRKPGHKSIHGGH